MFWDDKYFYMHDNGHDGKNGKNFLERYATWEGNSVDYNVRSILGGLVSLLKLKRK